MAFPIRIGHLAKVCNPPLNRTVYKVTIHLNIMELLVCWKPSIGFQHTNGL